MSDYIIPVIGVAKLRKSQKPVNTIQYNIMSTMSELHRLMQEIKQDDLDILADIAYQQEQAMREGMEPPKAQIPSDIDPDYENFISNHPDGIYPTK